MDIFGIQSTKLTGNSGREYEGSIYPIDTTLPFLEVKASVILTQSTRNGENDFTHHKILKKYKTENLKETVSKLKKEKSEATHFVVLEYPTFSRLPLLDDFN